MNDPVKKRIELWFRHLLMRILGKSFRRNNTLQENIDFNGCKILFIRQDRIGDVLISTPLFEILKNHYPGITLDVLLSDNNHFVLDNNPFIRKRWIYNKKIWDFFNLLKALRKEKYDFAVDLMDNPSTTTTIFCLMINAGLNIGIDKENRFVYDITVPMLSRSDTHIIERISQLLIPFKINPQAENFNIKYYTSSESEKYADEFLKLNKMHSGHIIGINISAGNKTRFWGIENFIKLLNWLINAYPEYMLMLLYQPSDSLLATAISSSNKNIILSPLTSSFDQFAAFIKRLTFLITPDTAAVHLASAFKIGAVVLYVQSDKSLSIWEPYGTDYECLVTNIDNLSVINVNEVQEAFSRLFKRTKIKSESFA